MSDTNTASPKKLEGNEKLWVEFGPIAVLLLGYALAGRIGPGLDGMLGTELFGRDDGYLFVGIALFIPAFAVAFVWSLIRTRRITPIMAMVAVLTLGLGTLTLILQDKRFTYMKPTIIYSLMAFGLGGGLLFGKNLLKMLFDGALDMADAAWRTLTWRFVGFNAAAAIANEILWRTLTSGCVEGATCSGETTWVWIKGIGFTAAYFIFIAANAPFLMKHAKMEDSGDQAGSSD